MQTKTTKRNHPIPVILVVERVVRENCTTLKCLSVRGLKKALDNQVHREQLETLDDAFPNVKKLREHFITQTHIRRPHLFLVLS